MSREERHDILFEPIQIGPRTLRNRFYQTPYSSGIAPHRVQANAHHRAVAAEGGWAAVNTGATSVAPEWEIVPGAVERLWDDEDAQRFRPLCEMVQELGALAGIELAHGGADAPNHETRLPAVGPSQLQSFRRPNVTSRAMTPDDIEETLERWASAARRATAIGFDIVYVYGAFSYLPAQFLSPYFNKRTDEYGGSLENRARFWLQALERVRAAVDGRAAVTTRLAADGLGSKGIPVEETLEFVRMADHLVDYWDFTVGAEWADDSGPSRFYKEGYQVEWSGRMREATSKPIVGVSRLTNPDTMASIIREGVWDVIGAARPRVADPFLPQKVMEGRYDEIRECTGSNICIATSYTTQIACLQNPTVGEEYRRGWHPERVPASRHPDRDVLVIGGGLAGLECALTLAKRGVKRIHLAEAEDHLGGSLSWVTRFPGLGEWARAIDYRVVALAKQRNVQIMPGTRLDEAAARDYGADLVIVATGSCWATDGLNGITHEPIPGAVDGGVHVTTPGPLMQGGQVEGSRVLVYDTDGYFVAPGIGELLARQGHDVELVTSFDRVSPYSDETFEGAKLRLQLRKAGVLTRVATELMELCDGTAIMRDADAREHTCEVDTVVFVTQRMSQDHLFLALRSDEAALADAGILAVLRAGDCLAPRSYADAVFDGHRVAMDLDDAIDAAGAR